MKNIIWTLVLFIIASLSCRKNNGKADRCLKTSSNSVTITLTGAGTPCTSWGIQKNGITYPVDSLGDIFKDQGLVVCAEYELYEDLRLCLCCGGTRAKIISMSR